MDKKESAYVLEQLKLADDNGLLSEVMESFISNLINGDMPEMAVWSACYDWDI